MNKLNLITYNPTTVCYTGIGAVVSKSIFCKLTHLAEYIINKKFGDYQNPLRTADNEIIVSAGRSAFLYVTQNIIVSATTAAICKIAIKILISKGIPNMIALPLLLGSVATPIFLALSNLILFNLGKCDPRWVKISDDDIAKYGIDKETVKDMIETQLGYDSIGEAPRNFDCIQG